MRSNTKKWLMVALLVLLGGQAMATSSPVQIKVVGATADKSHVRYTVKVNAANVK